MRKIRREVTRKVWKSVKGLKRRIADSANVTDRGAQAASRGASGVCSGIEIVNFSATPCNHSLPGPFGSEMKARIKQGSICAVLVARVGFFIIFAASAFAQEPAASGTAEVERVIVTGSNIPTAEETGPNPVDTYRPGDIEKLGIRNATDLMTQLPQEMGSSVNQNIANGGDGSVIPNLRGLLPKETLVLIDGKRAAIIGGGGTGAGAGPGTAGVDINLIPFPMIDHIDILKDGASALYGTDAVAGVINIFLKHKFRGLEIGGSVGNTNLGSSNDARELEGWLIAGTGDDKTDIVVVADFYDRAAIYSRDRFLTSNANALAFGGFDNRSSREPGRIGSFRLIPKLFFSANSPPPHSAPNVATSPYYVDPSAIATYPDGDYFRYNFAALTPAIPAADRQSFYGSFTRDICDKYLVVFADFKYTRSFFDAALAATPFAPDAFKQPSGLEFSPIGISVPIQNPFNPFTVGDATLDINGVPVPMTTGVQFRSINDQTVRTAKTTFQDMLFDVGLRGELGEIGDYFKNWNWELGFRYSRNFEETLTGGVVSRSGLREALLDTNPATAFNPFLGFFGRNSKAAISRVYVTLHNSGEFELPLSYFTVNGDLLNLPAGPVSFAFGVEYRGERWRGDPASENTSFDTIGAIDFEASRVNRECLGHLSGSADSDHQPHMEFSRGAQPRVRYCRTRGMVQPKYFCNFSPEGATFAVRRAETEIFCALAAARSQVDWCIDLACQLHGSVSCGDTTRSYASRDRICIHGPRSTSRSEGIDPSRNWRCGDRKWKPQSEARGRLRMVLWNGLQSKMDQGSYFERRFLAY
jgi:outer membrane receptor protein involved in Fe transport